MKLDSKLGTDIKNSIISKRTLPKQPDELLEVIFPNFTSDTAVVFDNINFPFAISSVKTHKIKSLEIVGKNDEKEVFEAVLDNEEDLTFLPGDTVGILPENDEEEIELMLKTLNLVEKADTPCTVQVKYNSIKGAKVPVYIPKQTTGRAILTYFINFKSVPKKAFLCALLNYCESETDKHFLETICSKEGSELYNDLILKNSITVLDLLKAFDSVNPPLSLLIQHLPRLLPRPYSISNSYLKNPNEIKIIFSSFLKNAGVTTKYLKKKYCNNHNSNVVNLYFRQPNKFRLIEEYYTKDILMISVGCAVSPFLGFLEQKAYLVERGLKMGRWLLYSGFKSKSTSIYRDQIIDYKNSGILEEYYECLSKDEFSQFKYVQDAVKNHNEFSSILLNNNSILFVCADGSEISKDIKICIQKCVFPDIDESDSKEIIVNWIKNGKYIEDVWT